MNHAGRLFYRRCDFLLQAIKSCQLEHEIVTTLKCSFTFLLDPLLMPQACPVPGCHGLAPCLMPRACPVELHAGRYTNYKSQNWMPRACPVEGSRLLLNSRERENSTGQARGIFNKSEAFYFRSVSASLRTASASDALGASVR